MDEMDEPLVSEDDLRQSYLAFKRAAKEATNCYQKMTSSNYSKEQLKQNYSKIQNTILTIGNDVMIGEYLTIIGGGHKIDRTDIPMRMQGVLGKTELIICDDVWIGTHVIITSGCKKIGKGAVIGAGSVVTHDVPEYTIVAGNPAREIRKR